MSKHAKLSASASKQWLACPPSIVLGEKFIEPPSAYANEGTEAHSLCEHKLRLALGLETVDPTPNLTCYDDTMEGCAQWYADYVLLLFDEAKSRCPDPQLYIEQRLDLSRYIPEGFGTADAVIVADDELVICDFKYGKGVSVSVENNPQMMCYALGALDMFGFLYQIKKVSLHIFQPRLDNIAEWEISVADLEKWADEVLIPTAKLAYEGRGEFCAGDHCRFCRAKATCRKRAEYNLELAKYDFGMPETLTDTEVEIVLERADQVASWVEDVKKYALSSALSGKKWKGFKLVEGRATRKFSNDEAVAKAVSDAGYDPYERKLLGITAMTSLLGRKRFNELLGNLIIKPQGKPTLVPSSDKRKALDTAKEDFNENLEVI